MEKREKNPFMISFSKKPIEYIDRHAQTEEILQTFTEEPITDQLFIIIGVRGSGKTVLLSDLANRIQRREDWTVVRCTPTGDIIHSISDQLISQMKRGMISVEAKLDLPVVGSVSIHQVQQEVNDELRVERFLEEFRRKKAKLLITIDEVTNTAQMREFASAFQIWIGKDLPVFFLGTGLYEKIMDLQNVDNMTFMYRAPKIVLGPLDMAAIARSYQTTLNLSAQQSREMSKLTLGYSFAFQALGYTYWNAMPVKKITDILPDYDALLADASYSKLWSELSQRDKEVCRAIAECSSNKVKDIRAQIGMDSNRFNQQRIRLKNQGLLDLREYGRISFALPRFREFIRDSAFLYESGT